MGHLYRYEFAFEGLTNTTGADEAIWELHPTTKQMLVWNFQLSLAVGAAAAGNLCFRLQREATNVHAAGTAAVIAKCSSAAPTATAVGSFTAAGLATAATTTGKLLSFGMSTAAIGSSGLYDCTPERGPGDLYTPICTVTGTEQLTLVAVFAVPVCAGLVSGSILWEEL